MEKASSSVMVVPQTGEVGENSAEIESLLGYKFRKPSLLREALTHGSHQDRLSYERLEFVGDAVLGLAVTKFLYQSNPRLPSGLLTTLRSANVSNEKFARAAIRHNLYRFLRHNSPPLDESVREFIEAVKTEGEEETGELSWRRGKVLADMVESLAAAVYIDCDSDLDTTWKVFKIILEPIITSDNMDEHPVTVLQHYCQKQMNGKLPKYTIIFSREKSSWEVRVAIENIIGIGSAANKKISKLQAARDCLKKLRKTPPKIILEPTIALDNMNEHPVTLLQHYCQKQMNGKIPKYSTIFSTEESSWEVRVAIDGKTIGIGSAAQKKISKLQAAQIGLEKLLKTPP